MLSSLLRAMKPTHGGAVPPLVTTANPAAGVTGAAVAATASAAADAVANAAPLSPAPLPSAPADQIKWAPKQLSARQESLVDLLTGLSADEFLQEVLAMFGVDGHLRPECGFHAISGIEVAASLPSAAVSSGCPRDIMWYTMSEDNLQWAYFLRVWGALIVQEPGGGATYWGRPQWAGAISQDHDLACVALCFMSPWENLERVPLHSGALLYGPHAASEHKEEPSSPCSQLVADEQLLASGSATESRSGDDPSCCGGDDPVDTVMEDAADPYYHEWYVQVARPITAAAEFKDASDHWADVQPWIDAKFVSAPWVPALQTLPDVQAVLRDIAIVPFGVGSNDMNGADETEVDDDVATLQDHWYHVRDTALAEMMVRMRMRVTFVGIANAYVYTSTCKDIQHDPFLLTLYVCQSQVGMSGGGHVECADSELPPQAGFGFAHGGL